MTKQEPGTDQEVLQTTTETLQVQLRENKRLRKIIRRLQPIAHLEFEAYFNVGLHYKNLNVQQATAYAEDITGIRNSDFDPV